MDENERLAALHGYGIVDSAQEPAFDELAALAAHICGAPVAILGFVEADREWVKARYRWNISHLPLEASFAAHVVRSGHLLVVEDTDEHDELRHHPLVSTEPKIRFIASVPVVSPDGHVLGAITTLDRVPRSVSALQQEMLRGVARQVTALLNDRRRIARLEEEAAHAVDLQQALSESEERFRELFGHADDLIMSIRADGRILHVNGASSHMLAYEPDELTGRSVFDFVHPDGREQFKRDLDRLLTSGEHDMVETTFFAHDGRRVIVEGNVNPKIVDGFPVLVRTIFRDITERKQAEVELGQARDAALESARLKSQFLSNVSHEIRTPIHSVAGMLGLLLETNLTSEQRDLVMTARSSADSLLTILNNILHVARLESGKLSVAVADFDVVTTVERVVDVMQIAAKEKGLELAVDFDAQLPAIVRGDASRYRQIVANLVNNAVKFTDKGKITVRLSVERETDTHTLVRFAVSDTGCGVNAETRARIFQPFTQGDASSTREHDGMGLGLTIAKQLVDLIGGIISFDSKEGEGSTFWFTVPFEKRLTERLAVAGAKQAFPGARVLILDESETNRKLLQHYVASWGMRSRFAENADEALERIRTEAELGDPYRAFVFDAHARGIDPYRMARSIKADQTMSSVGLVMLTHLGEQVDDQQARKSGISSYLAKPVDRSELFDCLTVALARDTQTRVDLSEQYVSSPLANVVVGEVPKDVRERARILLAEDKPLNQKLTLSQLRSLGYTAEAVSNGSEVIDALTRKEFDIILMDCQMPLMDGYETTMEIRRREDGARHTRIIAMTANALEGDREKCLAAGMDDYLPKPTRREELERALARAIAPQRLAR